jgi:hypothetical protein
MTPNLSTAPPELDLPRLLKPGSSTLRRPGDRATDADTKSSHGASARPVPCKRSASTRPCAPANRTACGAAPLRKSAAGYAPAKGSPANRKEVLREDRGYRCDQADRVEAGGEAAGACTLLNQLEQAFNGIFHLVVFRRMLRKQFRSDIPSMSMKLNTRPGSWCASSNAVRPPMECPTRWNRSIPAWSNVSPDSQGNRGSG